MLRVLANKKASPADLLKNQKEGLKVLLLVNRYSDITVSLAGLSRYLTKRSSF